jgi:hypothetical protein
MDEALRFFVENYADLSAVMELHDYADRKLRGAIIKLLYDGVRREIQKWSWGADYANPTSWKADDGFGWNDKQWITKKDEGVYFGVYKLGLSSVTARDEEDERPFLYLYHETNVGNLTVKALNAAIKGFDPTLELMTSRMQWTTMTVPTSSSSLWAI